MKRYIALLGCLLPFLAAMAQNDTTLNRNVTVEREFRPVVQSAGKINQKPVIIETTLTTHPVAYSDYNALLSPAFNTNDLLSQPTRFAEPTPLHGYVRAAIGHTNTLFDFRYTLNGLNQGGAVSRPHQRETVAKAGKAKDQLDVYAHHRAEWGRRANSRTRLGFQFGHSFSTCQLYFGLEGRNRFYTRHGRYFDPATETLTIDKPSQLLPEDKQTTWGMDAFVGVKSNKKQDFQYKVQAGYTLFALPQYATEHQVRSLLNLGYTMRRHRMGANLSAINAFISTDAVADSLYNPRHVIRMEPYYAYSGKRFNIHVGMNLDLNIGRGQLLSGMENVSFAPSPNVQMEGQIAKEWLTIYGDFRGKLSTGIYQAYMESMPYRSLSNGITSHHASGYIPVDGTIGFHIKPYRDLLINIYGGYAYEINQITLIATAADFTGASGVFHRTGDFVYAYSDYGRGKIGADFHYHYQDIIQIHLGGNYYFWDCFRHEAIPADYRQFFTDTDEKIPADAIFGRANWDLHLRIDGRIDEHWSLYSENFFSGKRLALTTIGTKTLKPTVTLNLGCQYEQDNWTTFLQLNNYIHRHNDIYYGYQSEGINFLLGGSYKF